MIISQDSGNVWAGPSLSLLCLYSRLLEVASWGKACTLGTAAPGGNNAYCIQTNYCLPFVSLRINIVSMRKAKNKWLLPALKCCESAPKQLQMAHDEALFAVRKGQWQVIVKCFGVSEQHRMRAYCRSCSQNFLLSPSEIFLQYAKNTISNNFRQNVHYTLNAKVDVKQASQCFILSPVHAVAFKELTVKSATLLTG